MVPSMFSIEGALSLLILPEQLSLSMSVVHKIKTKEVGLVEKEGC